PEEHAFVEDDPNAGSVFDVKDLLLPFQAKLHLPVDLFGGLAWGDGALHRASVLLGLNEARDHGDRGDLDPGCSRLDPEEFGEWSGEAPELGPPAALVTELLEFQVPRSLVVIVDLVQLVEQRFEFFLVDPALAGLDVLNLAHRTAEVPCGGLSVQLPG